MHLIRVLCNLYDDWKLGQQVKREQREWLLVSYKYGMYKDLRCLIGKGYIDRKRNTNADSYKIIILTLCIVCLACFGLSTLLKRVFTPDNIMLFMRAIYNMQYYVFKRTAYFYHWLNVYVYDSVKDTVFVRHFIDGVVWFDDLFVGMNDIQNMFMYRSHGIVYIQQKENWLVKLVNFYLDL